MQQNILVGHPKTLLTLLTLLLCLCAAGNLAAKESAEAQLLIVCSTTQVADFARAVVGDDMRVICLLGAGADPHTYQPTTADAELVIQADLCLRNGMHLEGKDWMRSLADDAGKPLITCTDGITGLEIEEDGHTLPDPHAWFDPANAAIYVRNIVAAVVALDAGREAHYRARAQLFLQQLKSLDAWIKAQVNAIPAERRVLVTSHDAFNYFCRAYGFTASAPVGWSTAELEGGMTPQRRAAVVESIRNNGVHAVFVETSVNPKVLQEIAREAGVRIGGELYSDAMGADGTAGETYIGMMRENVITLVEALR